MMASHNGHVKCVEQLLLRKDIGVNLQNNKECRVLMLASEKGHVTIIKHLEIYTERSIHSHMPY